MNNEQFESTVKAWFLHDSQGENVDNRVLAITDHISTLKRMETVGEELISSLTQGYERCKSCGRYVKDGEFEYSSENSIEEKLVYRDAGYGDDDEMGLVEVMKSYKICPYCRSKSVISDRPIQILKRWNAREEKKEC